jgi:hypothetical protein
MYAAQVLARHFELPFETDYPIPIGHPAKPHKFDLVGLRGGVPTHVGECKRYNWTESGNVPSAKMAVLNEALLYLSLLPDEVRRFIVMPRAIHARRTETLVEYYCRTYNHLLRGVSLIEIEMTTDEIKTFGRLP